MSSCKHSIWCGVSLGKTKTMKFISLIYRIKLANLFAAFEFLLFDWRILFLKLLSYFI